MVTVKPWEVTNPILAHIPCIAAIKGNVNNAVHKVDSPNCAPAWEYVAMPEGSSSLAPVIIPGPRLLKKDLIFTKSFGRDFIYIVLGSFVSNKQLNRQIGPM